MWIALAIAIVNKPGAGLLVGITQAIVMLSMGYFGNHGAVSLISYTMPGLMAEIVSLFFKNKKILIEKWISLFYFDTPFTLFFVFFEE